MSTGLSIDGFISVSDKLTEDIHNAWDTFDLVEVILTKQGFPPEEKPGYPKPALSPGQMESLSGNEITNLYIKFSAWGSYATNLLARIKGGLNQVENEMMVLSIRLRRGAVAAAAQAGEKKPSEAFLKELAIMDPRYQELMVEQQKLEQQRLIMESHTKALEQDCKVVSRHVEIRRQDLETNKERRALDEPGRLR